MELLIEKHAARRLARLPPKLARAILTELRSIATSPFASHANVKRLKGEKDHFRLRHGDWRALYRLDREGQRMIVEAVVPRGSAYR
jgi:mRNA interferase RelE/StbE